MKLLEKKSLTTLHQWLGVKLTDVKQLEELGETKNVTREFCGDDWIYYGRIFSDPWPYPDTDMAIDLLTYKDNIELIIIQMTTYNKSIYHGQLSIDDKYKFEWTSCAQNDALHALICDDYMISVMDRSYGIMHSLDNDEIKNVKELLSYPTNSSDYTGIANLIGVYENVILIYKKDQQEKILNLYFNFHRYYEPDFEGALDTNITKFPTYAPTSCISTLSRWYSTKPGDDFGTIFYRQDILRNKRKSKQY